MPNPSAIMSKKKIIFIVGSPNQMSQMYQISELLKHEYDCWFSQFHPDHWYERMVVNAGFMDTTIMAGNFREQSETFIADHGLNYDYMAKKNDYDLAVYCTDMLISRKQRKTKTIWVQEGMTDPLTPGARLVKALKLSGYFALNTSLNGTSNLCDIYCAGSEGYKNQFIKRGTDADKIVVTGIVNFDNIPQFLNNDFPHHDYVLITTSDIRECFRKDDRMGFLKNCKEIVGDRKVIFKLHPNELKDRAISEIKQVFGEDVLVYTDGNSNHMIANCEELITQYSTLVYVGIVLGKKVHSYFDLNELYRLVPKQNGGTSARTIAEIARGYIEYSGTGVEYLEQTHSLQKSMAA